MLRSNLNRLASTTFAMLAWMAIPALIFFFYFFVWLQDQTERETNRKLRALDEMTREFIATRDSIPNIVRNEQRRFAAGQNGSGNDPYWSEALEEEEERLNKLLSLHQQRLKVLNAEVDAFKRLGGAQPDQTTSSTPFIDQLTAQYAESVQRMNKLSLEIDNLDGAKQSRTKDYLITLRDSQKNGEENDSRLPDNTGNPDQSLLNALKALEQQFADDRKLIEEYARFWQSVDWFGKVIVHPDKVKRGKAQSLALLQKLSTMEQALNNMKAACSIFDFDAVTEKPVDTSRVCFDASVGAPVGGVSLTVEGKLTTADENRLAQLADQLQVITHTSELAAELLYDEDLKNFVAHRVNKSEPGDWNTLKVWLEKKADNEGRKQKIKSVSEQLATRAQDIAEVVRISSRQFKNDSSKKSNSQAQDKEVGGAEKSIDERRLELVDRLYREGENLKKLLEAEAQWMETAGLAGDRNAEFRRASAKAYLEATTLEEIKNSIDNIQRETKPDIWLQKQLLELEVEVKALKESVDAWGELIKGQEADKESNCNCENSTADDQQKRRIKSSLEMDLESLNNPINQFIAAHKSVKDCLSKHSKNAQLEECVPTQIELLRQRISKVISNYRLKLKDGANLKSIHNSLVAIVERSAQIVEFTGQLRAKQEGQPNNGNSNELLKFTHDPNSAAYFASLDVDLLYQPVDGELAFDALCQQDANRARYELDPSGAGVLATVCGHMEAEKEVATILGGSCEDGVRDGEICIWQELSRATWSFSDIGHLFQNYLKPTDSNWEADRAGEFEGILLLNTDAKLIRAFGDTSAAFADIDFLKTSQSPLLELAKSSTAISEDAAEQEVVRSQALSRTSVWDLEIGATNYRLYIRPVTETATYTDQGSGLFGFIVGLERKASFRASVEQIPLAVQAGLLLLVVMGSLALPVIRLRFLQETDAISPVEALTVIVASFALFAIVTVAGLTLANRVEFKEKTDNLTGTIAKKIEEEVRKELVSAVRATDHLQEAVLKSQKTADRIKYLRSKSTKPQTEYYTILVEEERKDVAKGFWPGWLVDEASTRDSGDKRNSRCLITGTVAASYEAACKARLPEVREVFALDSDGDTIGNIVTTRRSVSANSSLKDRLYFQRAKAADFWTVYESSGKVQAQLFAERIISRTSGERVTVISSSPPLPETDALQPVAMAQSRFMHSLWRPVMPPGFEFAIFDVGSGATLYHAHDNRSLVENFYDEVANTSELKATLDAGQKKVIELAYRGRRVSASTLPIAGTPWAVIVYYSTDMYDQIWMSTLSVSSIAVTLYIMGFTVLLLLLSYVFRRAVTASNQTSLNSFVPLNKRKSPEHRLGFQQLFWPSTDTIEGYKKASIGILAIAVGLLLIQTMLTDQFVFWVLLGSGVLTLLLIYYTIDYWIGQIPGKNESGTSATDQSTVMGWLLIVATLAVAILPASVLTRTVTETQFDALEKYGVVQMLRRHSERDDAVVAAARTQSPWQFHYDASKNEMWQKGEFESVKFGNHYFNSAGAIKAERKPSNTQNGTTCDAENNDKSFGIWLLSNLNFGSENGLFLRPFFLNGATDCSWRLADNKVSYGTYSVSKPEVQLPSLIELIRNHYISVPLASLIFLFFTRLYFRQIVEHLFGQTGMIGPNAQHKDRLKSLIENTQECSHVMCVVPQPLKREQIDINGNYAELFGAPFLGLYKYTGTVVVRNIEQTILEPSERRLLLSQLELGLGENAKVKWVLDCRINLIRFFNNPQNYRTLIEDALERPSSKPTAKADNADNENPVPETMPARMTRAEIFKALDLNADELVRWHSLLSNFDVLWAAEDTTICDGLWSTIEPKSADDSDSAIMDLVSQHQGSLNKLWQNFTFSQQLALYHLASGELLTRSARPTVCDLARLGVLEPRAPFTIQSRTLAAYVRTTVSFRDKVREAAAENKSWHRFRIPILLTLAAIVVLIVVGGGRNLTDSLQTIVGILSASVALLFRFLPIGKG